MSNLNGWGDGSVNNSIGWGQGANNTIGWGKSQLTSWSGLTDIDGGNLPSNSVAPAITGTAQEGQTLTCSTGTWSGSPTYTYQWKRNGNNIGGATSSTYLLVTADVGQSILCTVTATNFVGSATADSNTVTPTSSVDADAQAFITAAAITDPTQQSAINQLVVDLKGYNIWTKMKALYPFVGGTASAHKFNLKDPRDLDAAFRIVWSGGVTHSANGVQFGGVNGYGDTKLTPSISLGLTDVHTSYYSRTNPSTISSNQILFDSFISASECHQFFIDSSKILYLDTFNAGLGRTNTTLTRTDSFFLASRITGGQKIFRAGTEIASTTTNAGTRPNIPLFIGAANTTGGAVAFSNFQTAFASIGDGLTDTEAANFYTAVQNMQITLSRQV